MEINQPTKRTGFKPDNRAHRKYTQFNKLITELGSRELPEKMVNIINLDIDRINSIPESDKTFGRQLKKVQASILKLTEKELGLVPKNHYRNLWMALGMSAIGLPIGVAFGAILKNMGLIGVGLPIGMVIGMGIGDMKDKKANETGKQLDIEVK